MASDAVDAVDAVGASCGHKGAVRTPLRSTANDKRSDVLLGFDDAALNKLVVRPPAGRFGSES